MKQGGWGGGDNDRSLFRKNRRRRKCRRCYWTANIRGWREDFTLGVTQYEVTPGSPTIEQNRRRAVYTVHFEYIRVSLIISSKSNKGDTHEKIDYKKY